MISCDDNPFILRNISCGNPFRTINDGSRKVIEKQIPEIPCIFFNPPNIRGTTAIQAYGVYAVLCLAFIKNIGSSGIYNRWIAQYFYNSPGLVNQSLLIGYRQIDRINPLISGFITAEDDKGFTLMDSEGKTYAVNKDDVEAKRLSKVSLMPTGLAASMTAQDLMDLVAYLETLK